MSNVEKHQEPAPDAKPAAAPFVAVVKGNPTPTEVAALTAVLLAQSKAAEASQPKRPTRNDWSRPDERLRPRWAAPTSFYQHLW